MGAVMAHKFRFRLRPERYIMNIQNYFKKILCVCVLCCTVGMILPNVYAQHPYIQPPTEDFSAVLVEGEITSRTSTKNGGTLRLASCSLKMREPKLWDGTPTHEIFGGPISEFDVRSNSLEAKELLPDYVGTHHVTIPSAPSQKKNKDLELLPYYISLGGTKTFDLISTQEGLNTGELEEGNPVLREAQELAERLGIGDDNEGIHIASAGLTILCGYILRNHVHPNGPNGPRNAKIGFVVLSAVNVIVGLLNKNNTDIVEMRQQQMNLSPSNVTFRAPIRYRKRFIQ